MNRIYKVLWNAVRSNRIVTAENQTSHGKGRQAASVVAAAVMAALAGSAQAIDITPASGWGHTTVKPFYEDKGTSYDVTTTYAKNGIGVNRFETFKIEAKEIANLIHNVDGTKGLVNFVNQKVDINGTVNSIKNGNVGGDLFFVSPQGFAVGKTGVINAGSLSVTVPTSDAYNEWVNTVDKEGTLTKVTEGLLKKLQSADVPLNPRGIITVSGSINAGNRVTLAASDITLSGSVKTTVKDFSKLVNIGEVGKDGYIPSGYDGGTYTAEKSDTTGDVILKVRGAYESLDGRQPRASIVGSVSTTDTETGKTTVTKGSIEAAGKVLASASNTVDTDISVNTADLNVYAGVDLSGASITAGKGVTIEATNTISKKLKSTEKVNITTVAKGSAINSSVTATTTLKEGASIEATKDAKITSEATNKVSSGLVESSDLRTDNADFFATDKPLAAGDSAYSEEEDHASPKVAAYWGTLTTSSVVNIEQNATVTAANFTIENTAKTSLAFGASSSDQSLWEFYKVKLEDAKKAKSFLSAYPAIVASLTNEGTVTVAGKVRTGSLTINNTTDVSADLHALTRWATTVDPSKEKKDKTYEKVSGTFSAYTAAVVADFTSNATVSLAATADIGADAITLNNTQTSSVETTAEAILTKDTELAFTLNSTTLNSAANVNVATDLKLGKAGSGTPKSLTITNTNTTERFTATAGTTLGVSELAGRSLLAWTNSKVDDKVSEIPGFNVEFIRNVMGALAKASSDSFSADSYKFGGSLTSIAGSQTADLTIAPSKTLAASEAITLTSSSLLKDHHWASSGSVGVLKVKVEKEEDGKKKEVEEMQSGAVSLVASASNVASTLTVSDGSAEAAGVTLTAPTLTLQSTAHVEYGRPSAMLDNLKSGIEKIKELTDADGTSYYTDIKTVIEKYVEENGTTLTSWDNLSDIADKVSSLTSAIVKKSEWTGESLIKKLKEDEKDKTVLNNVLNGIAMARAENFLNVSAATYEAPTKTNDLKWQSAGSYVSNSQKVTSTLQIGKKATLTSSTGALTLGSETRNTVAAGAGYINSVAGTQFTTITDENAVGSTEVYNGLSTENTFLIREGAKLTTPSVASLTAKDAIEATALAGGANGNKGGGKVAELGAINVAKGSNSLSIDDEVTIDAGSIKAFATRSDNITATAGASLVNTGDSTSNASGLSVGLNVLLITNSLSVADNDVLLFDKDEKPLEASILTESGLLKGKDVTLEGRSTVGSTATGASGAAVPEEKKEEKEEKSVLEKIEDFIKKKDSKGAEKVKENKEKLDGEIKDTVIETANKNNTDSKALQNSSAEETAKTLGADKEDGTKGKADTTDENTTDAKVKEKEKQEKNTQLSAAGSIAGNISVYATTVTINPAAGTSLTIATDDFDMQTVTDKGVTALAGATATQLRKAKEEKKEEKKKAASTSAKTEKVEKVIDSGIGVAGAVALNLGSFTTLTTTAISGETSPLIALKGYASDNFQSATIRSVSDGTVLVEALSVAAANNGTSNTAVDIGLAVNLFANNSQTIVGGFTATGTATSQYDQTAWAGDLQVTGGTGLGLSLKSKDSNGNAEKTSEEKSKEEEAGLKDPSSGKNKSIGAVIAVAQITNNVESTLAGAAITTNRAELRALESVKQITTAVQVGVSTGETLATGDTTTLAISGSAAAAKLTNNVKASATAASLTLIGDAANLEIASRDAKGNEKELLDAITAVSWETITLASADTSNTELYNNAVLITNMSRSGTQALSAFHSGTSGMLQSSVVASVGASTNGVALGAAVLVNDITNNFTAESNTLKVTTEKADATFSQFADSNVVSIGVAVGAAGGKGKFSAAGSVIVSNVDQNAKVDANGLQTSGVNTVNLAAGNYAKTVNVVGNVGVSIGGSAVGASVLVMNTNNLASVVLKNFGISKAGTVNLKGISEASAWGAAVDGNVDIAGTLNLAGVVLVNRADNETTVTAESGVINADADTDAIAEDKTAVWSLAGNIAVSIGDLVGASGAVAYTSSGRKAGKGTQVLLDSVNFNPEGGATKQGTLDVAARASDTVKSLVIAAGVNAAGLVGFSGASATNEINRNVRALTNAITASATGLSAISVTADSDATIGTIAINGGGAKVAGVGTGIAVNRINSEIKAAMTDKTSTDHPVNTGTLLIKSKSANNIETIGVGGSGSAVAGVQGSTSVNLINIDTLAQTNGIKKVNVTDTASIEALSDNTIGAYGGQGVGSGIVGVGLSIAVNKVTGNTKAEVLSSEIETGAGSKTLDVETGIKDDDINDSIVNTQNKDGKATSSFDIKTRLSTVRQREAFNGLNVGATSTTNYKNLAINGGGAGTVAVVGTGSVIYHGGNTAALVDSGSKLTSGKNVRIFAGDYMNSDTSITTAAGSGVVATSVSSNVVTSEHKTESGVKGGSEITANSGTTTVNAEAKEGVSALRIMASGAAVAGVSAGANVTRLLSGANTNIASSTVTSKNFAATSDYLGRVTPLTISAAAAGGGSGSAAVNVTYTDNKVGTSIDSSTITTTENLTATATRRNRLKFVDVNVAAGAFGVAAGYVNVNTIDGTTTLDVNNSKLTSGASLTLKAENIDNLNIVGVNVGGALISAGATVIVNRLRDDATVNVRNASNLTAATLTIDAIQERNVDVTGVFVSLGAGTLGANVICTTIGEDDDPFASEYASGGVKVDEINNYQNKYATTDAVAYLKFLGKLSNPAEKEKAQGNLTAAEIAALQTVAQKQTNGTKNQTGTGVYVKDSTLKSAGTMHIASDERGKTDVTVGSGSAGAGVLAASVGTMRLKRQSAVLVENSTLESAGAMDVGANVTSNDNLTVWQAAAALGGGTASIAHVKVTGNIQTAVKNSLLKGAGEKSVYSRDTSSLTVKPNGISVAGISAGAMLGFIIDTSTLKTTYTGSLGGVSAAGGALSVTADRFGSRSVESLAGAGGGLSGVGAKAQITDSGNAEVCVDGITLTEETVDEATIPQLESLTITSLNRPNLYVKSYGVVAGGISAGVVQTIVEASGQSLVTVSNSQLKLKKDLAINATTGEVRTVEGDSDNMSATGALRITALSQGYGGSIVNVAVNSADVKNTMKTKTTVSGNTVSARNLDVNSFGFAVYKARSDVGSGGVVSSGANKVSITHETGSETIWTNNTAGNIGLADIGSYQMEWVYGLATSAGGAVILGEGTGANCNAAQVDHNDKSYAKTQVNGTIATKKLSYKDDKGESQETTGNLNVTSGTLHLIRLASENTKGTLAGGSGASVNNTMDGTASTTIADGVALNSEGKMVITSGTTVDAAAARNKTFTDFGTKMSEFQDSDTYAVNSAVYGGFAGTGIVLTNNQTRRTLISIGKNTNLTSLSDLTISAEQFHNINWRSRARSAGIINGVTAKLYNTFTEENSVTVDSGSTVKTLSKDATLTITADAEDKIYTEAIGDLQGGLAGGTGAKAENTINRTESVTIAEGTSVLGEGNVKLFAGRNAEGTDSVLDFETYTHAYSRALIPGAESEYKDAFNTVSRLTLNGTVEAVKNISLAATNGTVNTKESARFWMWTSSKDAGTVSIASTTMGERASNTHATEELVLNGNLLAGKNIRADVTISGNVIPKNTGKGLEIVDGVTVPTVTQAEGGVVATTEVGNENLANIYWSRYERLRSLLQEYGAKDSTVENRQILVAYRVEMEALKAKMLKEGYATYVKDEKGQNTDQIEISASDTNRDYIKVSNITVSGGSIDIKTNKVTGSGSLTANAAEHINITNNSSLALKVEDVAILEKGGELKFNGSSVTSDAFKSGTGFTGNVNSKSDAENPTVTITSKYSGTVKVKTENGGTMELTPDTSVEILGTVENGAGNLTVDSGKDILIPLSTTSKANRVAASGTLRLLATGSVSQSYSAGVTNTGGTPESLWKNEVNTLEGNSTVDGSKVQSDEVRTTGSAIVGGSDVFISGEMVNINGLVQSGYAKYGIELTEAQLNSRIEEIKAQWTKKGCPTSIDLTSPEYALTSAGHYKQDDGTYAYQVASWYDPVANRILVSDITPQGGHITITGKIASTGGGKLLAAEGNATVKIDAGSYDVTLGSVSTGTVKGSVKIIDTNYTGDNYDAMVTEYSGGETTVYDLAKNGELVNKRSATDKDKYNPRSNQYYTWASGTSTTTYYKNTAEQEFSWWKLKKWDWKDLNQKSTSEPTKVELPQDKTIIQDIKDRPADNYFVGWGKVTDKSESAHDRGSCTTYDNWTHFSGVQKAWDIWSETANNLYTYTLKADKSVDVGTLKGDNSVTVNTTGALTLSSSILAKEGTVTLTANKGISAGNTDVAIYDAAKVDLSASSGAIGTKDSAIRIVGSGSAGNKLSLSAKAKDNIYLDASAVEENVQVDVFGLNSTAGDVSLTAQGKLDIRGLQGRNIALTSAKGDVEVTGFNQLGGDAGNTSRINISAKNGSVRMTYGMSNLYVGRIEALNDVTISTQGAGVYDAIDRTDLDDKTVEERVKSWKEAGLIDADGNAINRYDEDFKNAQDAVKSDYQRYVDYKDNKEKLDAGTKDEYGNALGRVLTSQEESQFAALTTRFSGCANVYAAIEKESADKTTLLGQIVAGKDNYGWSQEDLLYAVADSVINPKASSAIAPEAKDANISAKTVRINAGTNVGLDEGTTTITADKVTTKTEEGLNFLKRLARAEAGDLVITAGKSDTDSATLTLNLKHSVSVNLTGENREKDSSVTATAANGNVYITAASGESLLIKEVIANGNVTLNGTGIYNAANDAEGVVGTKIVLNGHTGSVGTADSAISVYQAEGGWTQLTAAGLINVKSPDISIADLIEAADLSDVKGLDDLIAGLIETADFSNVKSLDHLKDDLKIDGVLTIYSARSTNESITLEASAIRAWQDPNDLGSLLGYISADNTEKSVTLIANGIGVADTKDKKGEVTSYGSLRVNGADTVVVKTLTPSTPLDGVYLTGVGAGTLTVETTDDPIKAKTVALAAIGGLTEGSTEKTPGHLVVKGNWTGESFDLFAYGDLTANSSTIVATTGDLEVETENGDISLKNSTLNAQGGKLVVTSGKKLDADGLTATSQQEMTISAKENVELASANLSSSAKVEVKSDTANVNASGLRVSKAGELSVAATAGAVDLTVAKLGSEEGSAVASVTISAANAITLTNANVKTTTGGISATATGGTLNATSLNATAKGALTLKGTTGVALERAVLSSEGNTTIASDTGAVNALSLTVNKTGDLSITSSAGAVDLTAAKLGSEADSNVASVTISAANAITLTNANVKTTTGGISATATGGTLNATSLNATAKGALTLKGTTGVALERAVLSSEGNTTIASDTGAVNASSLTVNKTGDLSITSSAGAVDLTEAKLGSEEGSAVASVTISAANAITLTNANVKTTTGGISATAEGGTLNATSLKATANGALTLKGTTGVALESAMLSSEGNTTIASDTANVNASGLRVSKAGELSVTATAGAVDLTAAKLGSEEGSEVASVTISAANAITLTNANVKTTTGGISATATGGTLNATSLKATAKGALTLKGTTGVALESAVLSSEGNASITSDAGNVNAQNASVTTEAAVAINAATGVAAKDVTINGTPTSVVVASTSGDVDVSGTGSIATNNGAVSITAKNGAVNASGRTIKGSNVTLSASGNTDATNVAIGATGDVSVQAGGSVTLNGLRIEDGAKNLTIAAGAGDVNLESISHVAAVSEKMSVSAKGSILGSKQNISVGTLELNATEGSINLSSSTVTTQGNITAKAGQDVQANDLKITVASGKTADVTLEAGSSANLSNLEVTGEVGALTVEGKSGINLTGANTGTANSIEAKSISLKTDGLLTLGTGSSAVTTIKSTTGSLAIDAGELTLLPSTTLTSASTLEVSATDTLTIGENLKATATSISLTGGEKSFSLGTGADLTATNGGISVLSSGDLELAGKISVSADATNKSEDTILIGAKGGMTIAEGGATITSEKGSVAVLGGQTLDIENNITVLSGESVLFYSDAGSVKFGDNAVIAAGSTESAIASKQYGAILITAGKDITLGEGATVLSDDLGVASKGDVRFAKNATLVSTTDGVSIVSTAGSIYLGESLTVLSNEEATEFVAAKDIVVQSDATLVSVNNAVNLTAGEDILFNKNFTTSSKTITMTAGRDLKVGSATFETQFTAGDDYGTVIIAGRNVVFGDNAKFNTTDVNIAAGGTDEKGGVTFGKSATMQTSRDGIYVVAAGDITFDDDATFVTLADAVQDDAIYLRSTNGDVTFGHNAIVATKKSSPIKIISDKGFVTVGNEAGIGDGAGLTDWSGMRTSEAIVQGAEGVTFGTGAFILSGNVELSSSAGGVTIGNQSYIYGNEKVIVDALETVSFADAVLVDSGKLVNVTSRTGDILINADLDTPLEGRVETINLTAAGDIIQTTHVGTSGIAAETLNIKAGGDVAFGAVSRTTEKGNVGGNDVAKVNIEAGGAVAMTLSSKESDLSINASQNGLVNGRLVVKSDTGTVNFNQDFTADSIGLYGAKINAKSLNATGGIEVATAPQDAAGVAFTAGDITGGFVSILLGEGTVDLKSVTSTAGDVCLARLSSDAADVVLPTVTAARNMMLMNAGGIVKGDTASVGSQAYIIGTTKANNPGFTSFSARKDVIYMASAENLAKQWNARWILPKSAIELTEGILDISMPSETELIDITRTTNRSSVNPRKDGGTDSSKSAYDDIVHTPKHAPIYSDDRRETVVNIPEDIIHRVKLIDDETIYGKDSQEKARHDFIIHEDDSRTLLPEVPGAAGSKKVRSMGKGVMVPLLVSDVYASLPSVEDFEEEDSDVEGN